MGFEGEKVKVLRIESDPSLNGKFIARIERVFCAPIRRGIVKGLGGAHHYRLR